jgi:hypothetical protein
MRQGRHHTALGRLVFESVLWEVGRQMWYDLLSVWGKVAK